MSRNTSLPTRSQVFYTLQSQKERWMRQMKPPVCQFKLLQFDNDLTLLHDYSSFIQSLLRWEGAVVMPCGFKAHRMWWEGLVEWKRFGVVWIRLYDAPQKNSHFHFHVTFALLCMASLVLFYLKFKCGVIAGASWDSSGYGLLQFDATYYNRI